MAGTVIIGKVAVKVFPNTKDFRKDTLRELNREERGLRVSIPTKLDVRGMMADYRRAIFELNRENKVRDARKLKVYTTVTNQELDRLTSFVNREIGERSRMRPIPLAVKLNKVISDKDLTVTVIPHVLKKDLEELKRKIREYLDGTRVTVLPVLGNVQARRIQFRLARLGRDRAVMFTPTLNVPAAAKVATALAALSGARLVSEQLRTIKDLLKEIDKRLPSIMAISEAIAGLGAWALSGSANLFALSASLAQIGQAALVLPGMLAAGTIGLGITILALKDFNKVLPDVVDDWRELGKIASSNFWAKFEAPMRRMSQKLLPQFRDGWAEASREMGAFFGAFADGLNRHLDGAIGPMFEDLANSITEASRGMDSMALSITILGKQGAGQLPRLATFFSDLNVRFAEFLSTAEKDGSLERWIEEGIFGMKEFGRATKGLAGILSGLARAAEAGGGTTLTMLADTLARVSETVNGANFQKHLTDAIESANIAMDRLSTVSGPAVENFFIRLSETMTRVMPMVGETIGMFIAELANFLSAPAMTRGVEAFFKGIQRAVYSLNLLVEPLSEAFGGLLDTIGKAAATFVPSLVVVLGSLSRVFTTLKPAIDSAIDILGGAFFDLVSALAPVFEDIAVSLAPVLVTFFQSLGESVRIATPYLAEMALALGEGVAESLKAIAPHLPVLAQRLFPQLLDVVKAIVPKLPALVDAFLDLVDVIVGTQLIPKMGELIGAVLGLAEGGGLNKLIYGLGTVAVIAGVLLEAATFLLTPMEKFPSVIQAIVDGLTRLFSPLSRLEFAFELGDVLYDAGAALIGGLVRGLEFAADKVKGFFTWLTTKIVEWKPKAKDDTLLEPAGRALISGLIAGLGAKAGDLRTALTTITTTITNKFLTVGTWLVDKGLALANGLKVGINDGAGRVKTAAGDLLAKARDALSGAGTTLLNAGGRIVSGFVQGIRDAFYRVRDILNELTGLLPSWKGPESRDRILLKPVGDLIIQSLIDGFESRYGDVKRSLGSLSDEIAGTTIAAPDVEGVDLRAAKLRGKVQASLGLDGELPDAPAGAAPQVVQYIYNPTVQSDADALNQGLDLAGHFGG